MYYSLPYKTKQFFWLLVKLAIVFGCGYFIYHRLLENDTLNFSVFYKKLIQNNIFSLKNILFLLFFSFFNWFLEITKWQKLASFCTEISFFEATKQSLASLTTSLITPNRIGEYGAKALYFNRKQRKLIVGLNLVGNFYQLFATLLLGFLGFGYFVYSYNITIDFRRVFRFLLLSIFVISAFFFGAKHFKHKGYGAEKAKRFIDKIPKTLNIKIALLSFLRYIVFSHQFYVLLLIFNININYLDAITAIASVYFVASIIPLLSLFDIVLKSTVATWIFSHITTDIVSILCITMLMWILNFVLPAIIGSYFVLTFKPITKK